MILLSYTTIDNLHKASHTWINKMLGLETPESEAMLKGKETHAKIQAHVSGKTKIEGLDLPMDFPTIEYHCRLPAEEPYVFHGYVDAVNFASKSFLEIKSSNSHIWSQGDFDKSIQPAYYSWVTKIKKAYLVSCKFDLSNLKVYLWKFTDDDWAKAEKWANEGIEIIKSGEYQGGLVNGKCTGCNYGSNCHFA